MVGASWPAGAIVGISAVRTGKKKRHIKRAAISYHFRKEGTNHATNPLGQVFPKMYRNPVKKKRVSVTLWSEASGNNSGCCRALLPKVAAPPYPGLSTLHIHR